jgi:hypothetical protein
MPLSQYDRMARFPPVVVRSRSVLEMASELVAMRGWRDKQVRVLKREQGYLK